MYTYSGVESQKYHLKLTYQIINLLTNKQKSYFFYQEGVNPDFKIRINHVRINNSFEIPWACAFRESGSKISQRTYFVFSNNLRCIDCKKPKP